jgi:hypothetical protein
MDMCEVAKSGGLSRCRPQVNALRVRQVWRPWFFFCGKPLDWNRVRAWKGG